MGYTTEFYGEFDVSPALNQEEIKFLLAFSNSRRMARRSSPYRIDGEDMRFVSGVGDDDVLNGNGPPPGQPGLWCQWIPNEDGTEIKWDEGEKFYEAEKWIKYLIEHFLKPNCIAKEQLPFLQTNHTVSGVIEAKGEEHGDNWKLIVEGNEVKVQKLGLKPEGKPAAVDYDVVAGSGRY